MHCIALLNLSRFKSKRQFLSVKLKLCSDYCQFMYYTYIHVVIVFDGYWFHLLRFFPDVVFYGCRILSLKPKLQSLLNWDLKEMQLYKLFNYSMEMKNRQLGFFLGARNICFGNWLDLLLETIFTFRQFHYKFWITDVMAFIVSCSYCKECFYLIEKLTYWYSMSIM